MSVIIGKLPSKIFESKGGLYHVFSMRIHGGKNSIATYRGEDAPKPLKTVEYVITGEWVDHKNYGKQFVISSFYRSKINNTEQANQSRILAAAQKMTG